MSGPTPPLPHMPSWRAERQLYLKKLGNNYTKQTDVTVLMLKLVNSFHSTDKILRKYLEVLHNTFSGNNEKRMDMCTHLML
jgi:hypothetical protein